MLVKRKSVPIFGHIKKDGPGIVAHAYNPSSQEAVAEWIARN